MSKPINPMTLSDRQVNALRAVTTGTNWERSRINRGTVNSLVKRGLLRHSREDAWGLAEITAEGRTALAAFAGPDAGAPAKPERPVKLTPKMQRALQLVCVGHGHAADHRSLAALVRRNLITEAQYRSDHRLTEAGRRLAAEE